MEKQAKMGRKCRRRVGFAHRCRIPGFNTATDTCHACERAGLTPLRARVPGNWNSGRRKVPTALRILRGNPSGRRLPVDEPKPQAASPDFDTPPPELSGNAGAMAEWTRVVPLLRVCGIITNAERSALIALCVEWSRWLDAQQKIQSLGMLIKGNHDEPIKNPYIRIARDSLTQCQRLWIELGLTPTSRTRLTPVAQPRTPPQSKWANDL